MSDSVRDAELEEPENARPIEIPQTHPSKGPSPHYLHGWHLAVVIASLYAGAFLIALDVNIINVPIPNISTEFGALQDVAWYGTAYLLTITSFQPMYGALYKYFNINHVYLSCMVLFEVGSILCAAATSSRMFIAGRAIAGLGAAGVIQGSLAIITTPVELEKRAFYMGIVISVFVFTVCIGPLLGGAFTQNVTWRWCFWINVPIGGVVLILQFFLMKIRGTQDENRSLPVQRKLDYMDPIGCVLFIGSLICLLLALQWGGQSKAWNSSTVVGLLVGFAVMMPIVLYYQHWRKERAMIPTRLLYKRSLWTTAMTLFCLGAAFLVLSFYIPFYFQSVQGTDPIQAGIRFIPLTLPQMLAVVVAGGVVAQFGHYVPLILFGEIVAVVGTALLSRIDIDTPTVYWAGSLVATGLGLGLSMQLPYTAIQVTLAKEDVPVGNAIAVFCWQLGGAVAIAIGQNLVVNTLLEDVPVRIPGISGQDVVAAGATNLRSISNSPEVLYVLRSVWSKAISKTVYLTLALVALSIPFTLAMDWLNSKKIAEQRKAAAAVEDADTKLGNPEKKDAAQ